MPILILAHANIEHFIYGNFEFLTNFGNYHIICQVWQCLVNLHQTVGFFHAEIKINIHFHRFLLKLILMKLSADMLQTSIGLLIHLMAFIFALIKAVRSPQYPFQWNLSTARKKCLLNSVQGSLQALSLSATAIAIISHQKRHKSNLAKTTCTHL